MAVLLAIEVGETRVSVNCKCGIALDTLRFLAYSAMSVFGCKYTSRKHVRGPITSLGNEVLFLGYHLCEGHW